MPDKRLPLTSSEIASIWTSYMQDSMARCVLAYFLKHVEDEEIHDIVQFAYDVAISHVEKLTTIFKEEQIPVPTGFTYEHDVNLNAPRMYTDIFMLTYFTHMAQIGLVGYSGCISMSAREDIRTYYREGLNETSELFEKCSKVALSKGVFTRAPFIAYPTKTDYVNSNKYLSGLNPLNNKRPLNAIEISHLFMNIQTNLMGSKLALSFAQGTSRENVRKWMLRGRDISQKHIVLFTQVLNENDIQSPTPSDVAITDSTTPPFSDKLIMYHIAMIAAAGMGNYALATVASQRSDLVLNYERLSLEIAQYAKDGADIMIEHAWLEQPPGTQDKEKLSKKKGKE